MGSTQTEVEVSYDVSNEFFRLWLDERMNYTSAVYESETQSLEAAQLNKLRILSDFAKARPGSGCSTSAAAGALASSTA
jgi:cyclopropane-fatty-acyl-phospholipid synthase